MSIVTCHHVRASAQPCETNTHISTLQMERLRPRAMAGLAGGLAAARTQLSPTFFPVTSTASHQWQGGAFASGQHGQSHLSPKSQTPQKGAPFPLTEAPAATIGRAVLSNSLLWLPKLHNKCLSSSSGWKQINVSVALTLLWPPLPVRSLPAGL